MTVREIDLERDAEQLVALVLKTSPSGVTNTEEWVHRRRSIPERAHSLSRAATSGDRILGFVESGLDFFGSGDLARVGVRVDPEFRRRGNGAELYEIALDDAARKNFDVSVEAVKELLVACKQIDGSLA